MIPGNPSPLQSIDIHSKTNYGSFVQRANSLNSAYRSKELLEAASTTRKIVDIPYLKEILAGLKGEDCPGLTTPFNTPVTLAESPFSAVRRKYRSSGKRTASNWTTESGYLTSCSLPNYSCTTPGTSTDHLDLLLEEDDDSTFEDEELNHEDFFNCLQIEINNLLEYVESQISILRFKVDSLSRQNLTSEELELSGSSGVEDMYETGAPGSFLHRARMLRRSLQRLSDTLAVNMSYLYRVCLDYDKSFRTKKADQYFTRQQVHVSNCTNTICNLVFCLDEKIDEADETISSDEEGDSDTNGALLGSRKRQNFLSCVRFIPTLLHLVMFVITVVILTVMIDRDPSTIGFYRLFRGPAIIILFIYMISLNMVVWRINGIKYHKMFQFVPDSFPTARELADYAGNFAIAFTAFACAFMVCLGFDVAKLLDKIFPCVMWGLILAFFFNPLKMFYRRGRWGLMKSLFRIVTAPFHKVSFGDFWLADQLNSLVIVLLDVEYLICYCSVDWSRAPDSQSCGSLTYLYIRPFLSILPAWFRFMQCLRDFYDSRDIQHVLNAIKYSTTFFVVITATLYSLHYTAGYPSNGRWDNTGIMYLVLWSVTSWIRALYTFLWDVNRDWGLFRTVKRGRICLRRDLMYRPIYWYYLVIAVDLVLRVAQTLKISLGVFLHVKSDLLFTSLAALEVIRRFIWNFFRLELQQVIWNNEKPSKLTSSVSVV